LSYFQVNFQVNAFSISKLHLKFLFFTSKSKPKDGFFISKSKFLILFLLSVVPEIFQVVLVDVLL
jgi:hypothetical protein